MPHDSQSRVDTHCPFQKVFCTLEPVLVGIVAYVPLYLDLCEPAKGRCIGRIQRQRPFVVVPRLLENWPSRGCPERPVREVELTLQKLVVRFRVTGTPPTQGSVPLGPQGVPEQEMDTRPVMAPQAPARRMVTVPAASRATGVSVETSSPAVWYALGTEG